MDEIRVDPPAPLQDNPMTSGNPHARTSQSSFLASSDSPEKRELRRFLRRLRTGWKVQVYDELKQKEPVVSALYLSNINSGRFMYYDLHQNPIYLSFAQTTVKRIEEVGVEDSQDEALQLLLQQAETSQNVFKLIHNSAERSALSDSSSSASEEMKQDFQLQGAHTVYIITKKRAYTEAAIEGFKMARNFFTQCQDHPHKYRLFEEEKEAAAYNDALRVSPKENYDMLIRHLRMGLGVLRITSTGVVRGSNFFILPDNDGFFYLDTAGRRTEINFKDLRIAQEIAETDDDEEDESREERARYLDLARAQNFDYVNQLTRKQRRRAILLIFKTPGRVQKREVHHDESEVVKPDIRVFVLVTDSMKIKVESLRGFQYAAKLEQPTHKHAEFSSTFYSSFHPLVSAVRGLHHLYRPFYALNEPVTKFPMGTIVEVDYDDKIEVFYDIDPNGPIENVAKHDAAKKVWSHNRGYIRGRVVDSVLVDQVDGPLLASDSRESLAEQSQRREKLKKKIRPERYYTIEMLSGPHDQGEDDPNEKEYKLPLPQTDRPKSSSDDGQDSLGKGHHVLKRVRAKSMAVDTSELFGSHRPIFLLIASLVQLLIFLISGGGHPLSLAFRLISNFPQCNDQRWQFWRLFTYQFVHADSAHITVNLFTQLLYGLPVNMVHGDFRFGIIYSLGVIGGALCTALVSPERTPVIGASGGVYAIIGVHLADLILNWDEYDFDTHVLNRWARAFILSILMGLDLLVYLFDYSNTTSYSAHMGGLITGTLIGLIFLSNFHVLYSEEVIKRASVALAFILAVVSILWFSFTYPPESLLWKVDSPPCCWTLAECEDLSRYNTDDFRCRSDNRVFYNGKEFSDCSLAGSNIVVLPDPTASPSFEPSLFPTGYPTYVPTHSPSQAPTNFPTHTPTLPPTSYPTDSPTWLPTAAPTGLPTFPPTTSPTGAPTHVPNPSPTSYPSSVPTDYPTLVPSPIPSPSPTITPLPTPLPVFNTSEPTPVPTQPSPVPTPSPTQVPTPSPTRIPTPLPTSFPTQVPTADPTAVPTNSPTHLPTGTPTMLPSPVPTPIPYSPYFDSGWFTMRSQNGTDSYMEVEHSLLAVPNEVRVMVRAVDGNNKGYIFPAMGAAMGDDSRGYGGVVFAYDNTSVRLWAPSTDNQLSLGNIINVRDGWGGEVNTQASSVAEVRIVAETNCTFDYDYDSGWSTMSSQAGTSSFQQKFHGIYTTPGFVRVLTRAVDGANNGYIFEGLGSAMSDDSLGNSYGGLVFGYNDEFVRMWAPDVKDGTSDGSIIHVIDGWGGEVNAQASNTAEVRVQALELPACGDPDFDSGWYQLDAQAGSDSYDELTHGLQAWPAHVEVLIQATDGNNDGYIFKGVGSAQTDDAGGNYGGVVFGYNNETIRVWAPDNNGDKYTSGYMISIIDGWGGEVNTQESVSANIRVLAWIDCDLCSFATPSPTITPFPTEIPTPAPTQDPTQTPSPAPSATPSQAPTPAPSAVPTHAPTATPSIAPTPVCAEADSYEYTLAKYTTSSRGWGVITYYITSSTTSSIEQTGTLSSGTFGLDTFCLPDDSYSFTIDGTNNAISWEFVGYSVSGGAPSDIAFVADAGVISFSPTPAPTRAPTHVPTLAPTTTPVDPEFDSGWFSMSSQAGTDSFQEIQHFTESMPDDVQVMVKAIDGNNDGFVFYGMGAAQGNDYRTAYGGLIFAYSNSTVRLWAPDVDTINDRGYIVNIRDGWGGETNVQQSETAMVRVKVKSQCTIGYDYDSGWFEFSSQAGTDSFEELAHSLGTVPEHVKVLTKAVNGSNHGYIFEGMGHAQSDDDLGNVYGGVVFGYNKNNIRLWAPDVNDGTTVEGSIINVISGWGGEVDAQASNTAMVRVLAKSTHPCGDPDFESSWINMTAQTGASTYGEVIHGLGVYPQRVKVLMRAVDGANQNYVFEGMGAAQNDDTSGNYGGVLFGFNTTTVRLWIADKNNDKKTTGYFVNIIDGWGGEVNAQASLDGQVKVLAWSSCDICA